MSVDQRTRFLAGPADDTGALLSLVGSGIFDSYVTYQQPGVRWCGGNVRAEVVMDRRSITCTTRAGTTRVPLAQRPLRQLGELVSAHLAGSRAYGYVTFEVAHLLHGTRHLPDDGPPLAHLIVPEVDIRWDEAGTTVTSSDPKLLPDVTEVLRGSVQSTETAQPTEVELTQDSDRRRFEAAVTDVVDAIRRRELRKAIISRRVEVPSPVDLPRTYAVGLAANTPARSYLLDFRGRRVAGFSPETVAEISQSGRVVTQPLAGTRPLRGEPEDETLREELRWDVKEVYEHVISTRLAYEELKTVCEGDSVCVSELMAVRERGTVQHLGSVVIGQLAGGRDAWDALGALFPAVTASGLPKVRALEAIAAQEADEREIYAGVVCMLDGSGGLDAALVLRSIYQDQRGTWLQAGAGIVEDSVPAREFDETTSKLRSAAAGLVMTARARGQELGVGDGG